MMAMMSATPGKNAKSNIVVARKRRENQKVDALPQQRTKQDDKGAPPI
jgi:hypothetical protein